MFILRKNQRPVRWYISLDSSPKRCLIHLCTWTSSLKVVCVCVFFSSVSAAVRALCLLVQRGLLCEGTFRIPADARQRRHDQSSEPCAHTRSLGHIQRGKTDWRLKIFNVKTLTSVHFIHTNHNTVSTHFSNVKLKLQTEVEVNRCSFQHKFEWDEMKVHQTRLDVVAFQEYTEEYEDRAMSSLFQLVCQLYKVKTC